MAELYQPGIDIGELRRATARLADVAAALTADGVNVRFTGASFVRSDESCFCRFESDSIDAVRTACRQAQFPYDRILPSDELEPFATGRLPSRRPPAWPSSSVVEQTEPVTDLETLAWGYGLVEGPRVDDGDNLYYSDVRNGGVYRRAPDGTIDVAVPKRRGVGGIALHADGGIVVSGRNVCHVRDGESRVVFAPDAPGLNDLFVDAAGRIICGTMRSDPFDLGGPRAPGECYLVDAEDHALELYGDVALTNGIGFSPDGSVLYHADSVRGVWAHDYDDGSVSGRRLFVTADVVTPDGLAVDESGTVWVADVGGSSAVRGFGPDGKERERIPVPAMMVTSVCFGGADRRDVYIVTADNTDDPDKGGSVFRTRADIPGVAVTKARV